MTEVYTLAGYELKAYLVEGVGYVMVYEKEDAEAKYDGSSSAVWKYPVAIQRTMQPQTNPQEPIRVGISFDEITFMSKSNSIAKMHDNFILFEITDIMDNLKELYNTYVNQKEEQASGIILPQRQRVITPDNVEEANVVAFKPRG
jgi:hypothetical protein